MNESHRKIETILVVLPGYSACKKKLFLETLLFYFTITGRAIHSDEAQTDKDKLDAFKWLNELTHRVWNIHSDLGKEESDDFTVRLYDNLKFYADMNSLLSSNLIPAFLSTYEAVEIKNAGECKGR